ncbi:polymer-forming cytoskeletal protein [Lutibacter sp.]|uniref:bactofilin family protein n=1 Tax=Lutibacter sp. TaxID=1925666 RepID=UPI001A1ABF5F|nr:polymer-forming cytoskeletal protein [Lutibacter sp.]MBI9041038.1 polymer-forming cytoskeletal protein [Lutibacter sp.]
MLSKKKQKEPIVSEINVIGKNTTIIGDIIAEGDFRVEGNLEGNIKTNGKIVIGASGKIKGKIECSEADIEGLFSGELLASNLLTLKATAIITGNVIISKLAVEPGAEFNATCTMKNAVKELNNGQTKQEKTA